MIKIKSCSC